MIGFPLANGLFGFFENTPEFLIINQTGGAGGAVYTGLSPIFVNNDDNQIGLNVGATDDWNGTLDGFEGIDLNETVLSRCSGDANSVWTSANNCQIISGFGTGGGGGGGAVDLVVAGGNIDVNSNTGSVLVSFDDGNFLGFENIWTATQTFNVNVNIAGDFNNNNSNSDANFNNLEADNIFGTFLGSIGDSADGNDLYVLKDPLAGQVISGTTDLNHLLGHTFLGHTFFIGESDDELVVIQGAVAATEHLFSIIDSNGFHLVTVLPNGEVDITHTATENGEVALDIRVNAQAFADIVGIEIDYVTGALKAEDEAEAIICGIDQSASQGGEVVCLLVLPTEGLAEIIALEAGILANPIRQLSGGFVDMNSAFVAGVDRLTEFTSTDSNIAMFVNDDDNVTIGDTQKFEEIEFLLDVGASGAGIKPTFEHSTGVGTFDTFNPADTTRGMRQTGIVAWDLELITDDWLVGANSEFIIRITRTANNLTTDPIEQKVQIGIAVEYFWNKDGSVFVKDLNASLLCLSGDCIDAWSDVNTSTGVSGIIAGGNIDVNSIDGDVRIDFDDGNFLSTPHTWSADQLYSGATFINFRGTTSGISSPISGQTEVKASSQVILQAGAQASIRAANESVTVGEGEAGVNWLWIIDGEDSDFRAAHLEDEDRLQFQDNIIMQNDQNFFFRDPQIGLQSSTDGQLDIYADTIVIATVPDFNTTSNTGVGGDLSVLGDSHLEGNVMAGNYVIFPTDKGICGDSDAIRGNGNDCNHSITFNGNVLVIQ